jgi:hypothetical protein
MPISTATKTFKRREWSKQDIIKLKQGARQKIPVKKLAKTLRRTEGATRQKAFSLELSMNSTTGRGGSRTMGKNRTTGQRRTGTHG